MRRLPLHLGYLTEEMVAKAKRELNETEDGKRKALAELRELLKEEPNLVVLDDDIYLLQFLRAKKFHVGSAFELITNYYETKKSKPELKVPFFESFKKSVSTQLISILPYRDDDGCPIYVFQLDKWNFNDTKFLYILRDLAVGLTFCLEEPATQVCGIKIIFDISSLSMNHLKHIPPKILYMMANGMKSSIPVRFKEIHVITDTTIYLYLWSLVKVVLSQKIRSRVYFHSIKAGNILKHIPADLVPEEYGGRHKINNDSLLEKICEMKERLDIKNSLGYKDNASKKEENST